MPETQKNLPKPQEALLLPDPPQIEELPPSIHTPKKGIALHTVRSIILAFCFIIIGFATGYQFRSAQTTGILKPFTKPVKLERSQLDFSQFWTVWDTLEANYVDPAKVDYQKMIYGAIQGMTAALGDPYTLYLPPTNNQQAKQDLSGEFDGVGIQLGYVKGAVAVQTPLENHPAIKAGVKAGDLILHIKDAANNIDKDTTGMTLEDAVTYIRGKRGTSVTLTFYRDGKGTFEKTITRETISMPSAELIRGNLVNGKWVKDDKGSIAWMRVYRFGDNTQEQWDKGVEEILRDRNALKGIVLDLRNNPGGYLQTSVSLASDFIPEGVVVKQQGRNDSEVYDVSHRARLLGIPLTVIINGGSASASEILAGALRDRLNVKLVGEKSFGKGTVQSTEDLPGGAGLHVTIAKWLLPNGDWIHEKGLKPVIEVKLPDTSNATDSATPVEDTQLERAAQVIVNGN